MHVKERSLSTVALLMATLGVALPPEFSSHRSAPKAQRVRDEEAIAAARAKQERKAKKRLEEERKRQEKKS